MHISRKKITILLLLIVSIGSVFSFASPFVSVANAAVPPGEQADLTGLQQNASIVQSNLNTASNNFNQTTGPFSSACNAVVHSNVFAKWNQDFSFSTQQIEEYNAVVSGQIDPKTLSQEDQESVMRVAEYDVYPNNDGRAIGTLVGEIGGGVPGAFTGAIIGDTVDKPSSACVTAWANFEKGLRATEEDQIALSDINSRISKIQSGTVDQATADSLVQNSQSETQLSSNPGVQGSGAGVLNQPSGTCSMDANLDISVCMKVGAAWIAYMSLIVMAWLAAVGAMLLNTIIDFSIVNMATHIAGMPGINTGWQLLRDIGNMIFIFLLLYVAIKTILGMADGKTKKLIINIIIAGLLVNFSLFFTKVIIDSSNILTIGFYNLIVNTNAGSGSATIGVANPTGTGLASEQVSSETIGGLSGKFADIMNLNTLWGSNNTQGSSNSLSNNTFQNIFIIGIGGSIFLILLAVTFFVAAILIIVRFIVLVILLILSPLAYIAYVLPETRKYAKQWWNALFNQCVFAPLYMLLLYLVLVLAISLKSITVGTGVGIGIADALTSTAPSISTYGEILNYIIIIGFLWLATVIAVSFASKTPGVAGKVAKWGQRTVSNTLRGTTIGAGGYVARETVGRKAAKFDTYLADKTKLGNSRIGRWVRSGTTGAVADSKFGLDKSGKDIEKYVKDIKTKKSEIQSIQEEQRDIKAGLAAIAGRSPGDDAAIEKMERTINQMSDKNLLSLKLDQLKNERIVKALSARQLEALDKSDKFTDNDKTAIKNVRFTPLNNALAAHASAPTPATEKTLKDSVRALSDKEIEMLNPETLKKQHFVDNLSGSQYDSIIKSNKFITRQKNDIRTARRKPLMDAVAAAAAVVGPPAPTTNPAIQSALSRLGNSEVAKLPTHDPAAPGASPMTLRNPEVIKALTPGMLGKIADEVSDRTILSEIGTYLKSAAGKAANLAGYQYVMKGQGRFNYI